MLQTKDKKKVHPVDQLGYPTVSLQHIAMREGLLKFVKHLGEIKQAKKKKRNIPSTSDFRCYRHQFAPRELVQKSCLQRLIHRLTEHLGTNKLIKVKLPPYKYYESDISSESKPTLDERLKLEPSAFKSFYGGNLILINSFDNKLLHYTFPPTSFPRLLSAKEALGTRLTSPPVSLVTKPSLSFFSFPIFPFFSLINWVFQNKRKNDKNATKCIQSTDFFPIESTFSK